MLRWDLRAICSNWRELQANRKKRLCQDLLADFKNAFVMEVIE